MHRTGPALRRGSLALAGCAAVLSLACSKTPQPNRTPGARAATPPAPALLEGERLRREGRTTAPTPAPDVALPVAAAATDDAGAPAASSDGADAGASGPRTIEADNTRVEVRADHQIAVHTVDRWGAEVNTTYESCEYLQNALPTLRTQLAPERYAALEQACGPAPAGAGRTPPRVVTRGRPAPRR